MAAPKIMVFGSLQGRFDSAFQKLATLHSKNNFSLAILTGDVFGPPEDASLQPLLDGTVDIAVPTYFTVGTHPLPPAIQAKIQADEEICPNLHYLGKRVVMTTTDGVRIVALGGQLDPSPSLAGKSADQHLPFHTADDASSLRGAHRADILLTSTWPAGVTRGSQQPLEPSQRDSIQWSDQVAQLCAILRPRYHLTASPGDFVYEREPFCSPAPNNESTTRFLSLAPYGNPAKAKALYAFSLNKSDVATPSGATSSPFADSSSKKRSRESQDAEYSRYSRQDHGYDDDHHSHRSRRHHKKRRRDEPPPGPESCYFCLSNPNISEHMCAAIGEDAYITTAKGPLTTSSTFADVGIDFPAHLIIIPFNHSPTIPSIGSVSDPQSEAVKSHDEMLRFREALQAAIAARSSHRLGLVTWEISRERNVHLIWQLLPLPIAMIKDGMAEAAFRVEAENQSLPPFTSKELALEDQPGFGDFFRVVLWADDGEDKIKGTSLIMALGPDVRFDLQLGRRVCAKLMGLESRFVWQECAQTEEEEKQDVAKFREAFKGWDFT